MTKQIRTKYRINYNLDVTKYLGNLPAKKIHLARL